MLKAITYTTPAKSFDSNIFPLETGLEYKNSIVLSLSSFKMIEAPNTAAYIATINDTIVNPSLAYQPKTVEILTTSKLKLLSNSGGKFFIISSNSILSEIDG